MSLGTNKGIGQGLGQGRPDHAVAPTLPLPVPSARATEFYYDPRHMPESYSLPFATQLHVPRGVVRT